MNPIRQKQLSTIREQIEPLQNQLRTIHFQEQVEYSKMLDSRLDGEDGTKSGTAESYLDAAIDSLEYLIDYLLRAETGNESKEPTEHMKAILERRQLEKELEEYESSYGQRRREIEAKAAEVAA